MPSYYRLSFLTSPLFYPQLVNISKIFKCVIRQTKLKSEIHLLYHKEESIDPQSLVSMSAC